MKRIETHDPDRLKFAQPLGFDFFFYGLFALAGVVGPVVYIVVMHEPGTGKTTTNKTELLSLIILGAVALAWLSTVAFAGRRAFRRVVVMLDRKQRSVRTRKWWPMPLGAPRNWSVFQAVLIGEEVTTRNGTYSSSRTTLYLLEHNEKKMRLIGVGEQSSIKTLAEDIAYFMHLDVIDARRTVAVRIPYEHIAERVGPKPDKPVDDVDNASVPDRDASDDVAHDAASHLSHADDVELIPPPPTGQGMRVTTDRETLRIEMTQGNAGCFVAMLLVLLAIGVAVLIGSLNADKTSEWLGYVFFGVIGAFLVLMFGSSSPPHRVILEAGAGELIIRDKGLIARKQQRIAADRVRDVAKEKFGMTIRWDDGQWQHVGLTANQYQWIIEAFEVVLPGYPYKLADQSEQSR